MVEFSFCIGNLFLFDYAVKSINFIFRPNYANELQIVYNRYGKVNSTKRLSKRIIKKLNKNQKNDVNVVENNNNRKERKHRNMKVSRENGIVQRIKRDSKDIEVQSVSQSKEISKSNGESLSS